MIDTQALRNKLLSLALEGKLLNDFEKGNTDNELIAELKSINPKATLQFQAKDLPFHIPDNWNWVILGDIFAHNTGKALNSSNGEGVERRYITTSNVYWDHFDLSSVKTMFFKTEEIDKCTVTKGDLLVCEGGDIGRAAIWNFDFDICIQNHLHRLRSKLTGICVKFYYYVLMFYKNINFISGRGIGLQGLSSKKLHNIIVPMPPKDVQTLIVEKLDSSFEILGHIDDLQARYAADREVLKSKLIDAAIRGKLTKQLPEDGTAEELYKQIQEEKKTLIKEKKIKSEKALPPVTEEEKAFKIPDNWGWCHLGDIASWAAGATPNRGEIKYYKNGDIPWLKTGDLNDGYIENVPECITELALKETSVKLQPPGTVLIAMYGATVGKLGITTFPLTTNQACCGGIPYRGIYNKFLFYFLMHHKTDFIKQSVGGAQPNISRTKIIHTVIPLPPLAEQKRIVEKLESLLPLCDQLGK